MKNLPKRLYRWTVGAGRLVTALFALWAAVSVAVAWLVARGDVTVPAWAIGVLIFAVGLAIAGAFMAGRGRRLFPTAATELEGRLEIASNYLLYTEDFMSALREAVSAGAPQALERLPRLRELLLDAVVQSINTEPGEHVRCALFVPREDPDGLWLVARYDRGHTEGVKKLRLYPDARSVAGASLTTQEPIYVPDADADPRVQATTGGRRPVKTLLCLPSFQFGASGATPLGVLSVTSNKVDAFDEADQAFISLCANLIGLLEFATQLFEAVDKLRQAVRVLERGTGIMEVAATADEETPAEDAETGEESDSDDATSRPPSTV
jgi:hypothetical protein